MPLIRIDIYKGKSREYKKAIFDGIHDALVESFNIPEDDRNQRLYEFDNENFESSTNKTNNFTIIEITAFKGRTKEAKKVLYQKITEKLFKNPGISPTDIVIYINEPVLENWGIRGLPGDEVVLGFKINV